MNNQEFAGVFSKNLLENASQKAMPETILRDSLSKTIFNKLEAEGCDFNGATRGKVEIAKRWLREIVYPWYRLKSIATPTHKMGPVVQELNKLDLDRMDIGNILDTYAKSVKLHSYIKFEIQLERPGYLILLEKGTSGKLYCLSPSCLALNSHFPAGTVSLPQKGAPIEYIEITGETGTEEFIAAIAPERPKLDWLPKPDQTPLLLQGEHLQEFLAYFEGKSDCTLWYMDYQVV